jgi:glucose/arabinose dehydrogenase
MGPSAPGGAAILYKTHCASCHGNNLAGERSASLLDDTWAFGGDDESVAASIRAGRPGTAMPPFGAVLNEEQIRALVIYIREEAHKARTRAVPPSTTRIDRVVQSEKHAFRIETVMEGLDTPWGLEFLPDGRMIVTERPGRVRIITAGKPLPPPVEGTPAVWAVQDGGLLDVALHPDFAKNGWIYLAYSEAGAPMGASNTVIIRGRVRDGKWVDQEVLFRAAKELYWADNTHFGLRFLFDRTGRLLYSIGDRGHQDDSQSLANPHGKIHRVNDDGTVPKDNPFVDKPAAVGSIWSYGNRNVQGLAFHPVTGDLWASEHGPRGGDEINVIEPGHNYGWPVVTHGMNYDGTPITSRTQAPGMDDPVVQWTPSIAVCGLAFYTGGRFPKWKNDLFATALAYQELRRLTVEGRKVTHQEVLFKNLGRVRDVVNGPDGYLYVLLNNPGRIVRLVPAS